MNTFDEAKSIRDLCDYYCFRCTIGLEACKISALECNKIRQDRDFETVTQAKKLADTPQTEDEYITELIKKKCKTEQTDCGWK